MLVSGITASSAIRTPVVTYAEEVLADSPLAYWKLDEVSGTAANDSSGNGYDGTYASGYTLLQPALINAGTSVDFDGTASAGVDMDATAALRITGDITIEAWVEADAFVANQHIVSCAGDNTDAEAENFLYSMALQNTTGAMYMFSESGAGVNQTIISTHTITASTVHHLVVVRDATAKTITFFDNGVEYDTIAYADNSTGGTNAVVCIADAAGAGEFDGRVDEVAIYNTKLSAARILAHYNAGL